VINCTLKYALAVAIAMLALAYIHVTNIDPIPEPLIMSQSVAMDKIIYLCLILIWTVHALVSLVCTLHLSWRGAQMKYKCGNKCPTS